MVKAFLAANYAMGDSTDNMVDVLPAVCVECGGVLDPVLGKVLQGTTISWLVWIEGNYEHRTEPDTPHVPNPR